MIKTTVRLELAAVLAMILVGQSGLGAAPTPRKDINPALLYAQAFQAYPELSKSETRLLGEPQKASRENAAKVAAKFDDALRLLERAAQSSSACDWGVDLADGPSAFVPSVQKIRTGVAASLLRAQVCLDTEQPERAISALTGALVMARHSAANGTLVMAMVQVEVENSIADFLHQHLSRFDGRGLYALEQALGKAPPHVTVAQAMQVEKACFFNWFIGRLETIAEANHGDENTARREVKALWSEVFSEDAFARLWMAGGGTMSGLVEYCRSAEAIYDEFPRFASAGPGEIDPTGKTLGSRVERCDNVLLASVVPNIERGRAKELKVLGKWETLQASLKP